MKTFRFIGMALFAVLMCVNFASCSSDDEPEIDEGKTTTKLLRFFQTDYGYSNRETSTFTYNSKGQLTKVTCGDKVMTVEWSNSGIYVKNERYEAILTLKDGIIVSSSGGLANMKITYDENKRIIKAVDENNVSSSYTWDSNNIVSVDSHPCTYYTDIKNTHPIMEIIGLNLEDVCPMEKVSLDVEELLMAHPTLIGNFCKNPIKSFTGSRETTYSYTYEFDNEGYPTKIVEKETDKYGNSNDSRTYTLMWQ